MMNETYILMINIVVDILKLTFSNKKMIYLVLIANQTQSKLAFIHSLILSQKHCYPNICCLMNNFQG